MIGSGDNHAEDQQRVCQSEHRVQNLREGGFANGLAAETAEDLRVVEEGTADHKGVGEVETGHGGKLIHGFAVNPDTFGVILANGVEEVVGVGEETRRHARVYTENGKCEEVAEGHGAADKGKGIGVGGFMIIPGDESAEEKERRR